MTHLNKFKDVPTMHFSISSMKHQILSPVLHFDSKWKKWMLYIMECKAADGASSGTAYIYALAQGRSGQLTLACWRRSSSWGQSGWWSSPIVALSPVGGGAAAEQLLTMLASVRKRREYGVEEREDGGEDREDRENIGGLDMWVPHIRSIDLITQSAT